MVFHRIMRMVPSNAELSDTHKRVRCSDGSALRSFPLRDGLNSGFDANVIIRFEIGIIEQRCVLEHEFGSASG
jgi:hypothetical protein